VTAPLIAPALLDTDTVSEILKRKHAAVRKKASAYLRQHRQLAFSAITWYEVIRGLRRQRATAQLQRFATFCQHSLIFDDILDRTADLWVTAYRGGHPRNDADLLIAATALEHGQVLVTGNVVHFAWIPGLTVENWHQP
jgi:tRNA(fMet)-specific endonuclease VapC